VLAGAAPHAAVLVYITRPRWWAVQYVGEEAGIPYALYGWLELVLVPLSLVLVVAVAAMRRTRQWAVWFLLGTLGGATAVLMALALMAGSWQSG
jgi:hypothetical protein